METTKTAYYQGVKVKLTGNKIPCWGKYLIEIKFPSGAIYACKEEDLKL